MARRTVTGRTINGRICFVQGLVQEEQNSMCNPAKAQTYDMDEIWIPKNIPSNCEGSRSAEYAILDFRRMRQTCGDRASADAGGMFFVVS